MRKSILLILLFTAVPSFAGDYTKHCYDKGLAKYEVYDCLSDIEERVKLKFKKKIIQLQKAAVELQHPRAIVSDEQVLRMTIAFESHLNKHCSLLGTSMLGTGYSQELTDCEIRFIQSRINDIDYLIKHHYR